jgi:TolA-binding protein
LADLAKHFKNASKYDIALGYYEELLEVSKDADLVADAYLSKGMIYFNSNKVEDAITQFLFVVNNYQQTKYFKEALSGLQSAYASLGQIEQYLAIIDGLPEVSITKAEQDSLIYNTAFMKFAEGDYAVANTTFTTYLQKFEDGIFSNDATYYNAISALKTGDTTSAIRLYKAVVESAVASYQEAALIFLARQYYKLGDFELSNPYYKMLEEIASNNSLKREAIIRLMYGNENTNSDLAFTYAQKVVGLEKTDDWLLSKATIIIARNEFENGNYAKSRKTFEKVEQLSKYDEGAEAKYYLAYLTYLDDSLQLAEQMIFQLAEQYSSDHFIAKAFLLLADIYIVQDNNFQAKATLESIIENHDGEDLVNVARTKWEKIVENEIMVEEVVEEQYYIDILEDEIDYELEFDNDTLQIIDRDYEVVAPDTIKTTTDSLNIIHKNTVEDEIE